MKTKRTELFNKLTTVSKKEIGRRFYEFRRILDKTQLQLAQELSVYQSTITNLEVGKTFPSINYILYFRERYGLNPTWLVSGEGEMLLKEEKREPWAKSTLPCHLEKIDPRYSQYVQLLDLLRIPAVESVIMGKISELLMFGKDKIEAAKEQLDKKNS